MDLDPLGPKCPNAMYALSLPVGSPFSLVAVVLATSGNGMAGSGEEREGGRNGYLDSRCSLWRSAVDLGRPSRVVSFRLSRIFQACFGED